MNKERIKAGFTLIELMIVVAIIGILAAIAIPKFADLISKSNEANTKGNLGTVRSAVTIYYADTEGWYPTDTLQSLTTNAKYMTSVPLVKVPAIPGLNSGHPDSAGVTGTTTVAADLGGWNYDNASGDTNWGRVVVACTHKDTKGRPWTSY